MRLLRHGEKGKEKPAALDKNNKIRDLSSVITDYEPKNLNFELIDKLKKINLEALPEVPKNIRIGSCISKPGKFIGIGLNYSDHAAETGAKSPKEPIVFMKATSCLSNISPLRPCLLFSPKYMSDVLYVNLGLSNR